VATTQGMPITLALVVAAPLCWGVIAAKPPRICPFATFGYAYAPKAEQRLSLFVIFLIPIIFFRLLASAGRLGCRWAT